MSTPFPPESAQALQLDDALPPGLAAVPEVTSLLEAVGLPIGRWDAEGRLTFFNPPCLAWARRIWVEWTLSALRDEDGRVVSLLTFARDVTHQVDTHARLLHQAERDALTGVLSRRAIIEQMDTALMRKRRAVPSFLIPLGGPDANAAGLGALSRKRRAAPSFLDTHGGRAGRSPALGALSGSPSPDRR